MRRRTERSVGRQVGLKVIEDVVQRVMPLVAGIAATKRGLMEWVHDFGLQALTELMSESRPSCARTMSWATSRRKPATGNSIP
jgi:hypothetical protein